MTKNLYYFVFPYCFVVKGEASSIIFNAQKGIITYITDSIISLINLFEDHCISEIEEYYSDQSELLQETISYLKGKGIIGIKQKWDIFPNIDLNYSSPEHIKHLVIEYSDQYDINAATSIINKLLVKFVEIRFSEKINIQELRYMLSQIYKSTVKSAQLVVDYQQRDLLRDVYKSNESDIVSSIIFYGSPFSKSEVYGGKCLHYVKSSYPELIVFNNNYAKNCIFDLKYFILAHSFNPYYYKRLCIDRLGCIKNCLKNEQTFGNIMDKNIDILSIINSCDFQYLWKCTCDRIIEIKDNPLRYNMYVTNNLREVGNGFFSIIS